MSDAKDIPFSVNMPLSFFEKAGAEAGKGRRIGGVISTERRDVQGDTVLQRGLDFTTFLDRGWFNMDHSKSPTDVLGYPEEVKQFRKGTKLPNGKTASHNTSWVEGYLLNTPDATKIWELGKALEGTDRQLGYSVEGGVRRRSGPGRKIIAEAVVKNVAITHQPVNTDSSLQVLAKSLEAVEEMGDSDLNDLIKSMELDGRLSRIEVLLEKALTVGTHTTPIASPTGEGVKTGEGAAQVIAKQSLEQKKKCKTEWCDTYEDTEVEKLVKKSLSDVEAIQWAQSRRPGMSLQQAARFVDITKALRRRGKL